MTGRIAVLSSMATRGILTMLAQRYEQRSGLHIGLISVGGVDAAKRIRAGDRMDVVVLASKVMAELESEGWLAAGSLVALARSGIAMAVRSGLPAAKLDGENDVRRSIVAAGSIAYSTGPSGDHLKRLLRRWDIEADVASRLVQAKPGVSVGSLLADGEADLGFQQLSELIGISGIEVVGLLPVEIQSTTIFAAGICKAASSAADAQAFLAYLASPECGPALCHHGLQPV